MRNEAFVSLGSVEISRHRITEAGRELQKSSVPTPAHLLQKFSCPAL